MKHFYYTISKSTRRRLYGGYNEEARIYKLVKGKPFYLATAKWCTASMRDQESEVMHALMDAKFLSYKKWWQFSNTLDKGGCTGSGYYVRDNGKFLIHSL